MRPAPIFLGWQNLDLKNWLTPSAIKLTMPDKEVQPKSLCSLIFCISIVSSYLMPIGISPDPFLNWRNINDRHNA
ncbi:hypothetical protein, partial [Crocosphaera watsonii]|uniref:hypothetical protein n=1 Tax=Crocosphaera watsonii TaxID=263511 RepID=UPI001E341D51